MSNVIKFKVQTVNHNPEVIKTVNGIATEIVAGQNTRLTLQQANNMAAKMNRELKSVDYQ